MLHAETLQPCHGYLALNAHASLTRHRAKRPGQQVARRIDNARRNSPPVQDDVEQESKNNAYP